MKLFIYATEIEDVLKGDFAWSLSVSSRDDIESGWIVIGEIETELNLDHEALTGLAVNSLENEIKDIKAKTTAAITVLEGRKQNLLSLTHQKTL